MDDLSRTEQALKKKNNIGYTETAVQWLGLCEKLAETLHLGEGEEAAGLGSAAEAIQEQNELPFFSHVLQHTRPVSLLEAEHRPLRVAAHVRVDLTCRTQPPHEAVIQEGEDLLCRFIHCRVGTVAVDQSLGRSAVGDGLPVLCQA